jgi:hypothetical protein
MLGNFVCWQAICSGRVRPSSLWASRTKMFEMIPRFWYQQSETTIFVTLVVAFGFRLSTVVGQQCSARSGCAPGLPGAEWAKARRGCHQKRGKALGALSFVLGVDPVAQS